MHKFAKRGGAANGSASAAAATSDSKATQLIITSDDAKLRESFASYVRHVINRQYGRPVAKALYEMRIGRYEGPKSEVGAELLEDICYFITERRLMLARINESELLTKGQTEAEVGRRNQFVKFISDCSKIDLIPEPADDGKVERRCTTTQQTNPAELAYVALYQRPPLTDESRVILPRGSFMDKTLIDVARLLTYYYTIDYRIEASVDAEKTSGKSTFADIYTNVDKPKTRFGQLFEDWFQCRRDLVRIFELDLSKTPVTYKPEMVTECLPWVLSKEVKQETLFDRIEFSMEPRVIAQSVERFPFVSHEDRKIVIHEREEQVKELAICFGMQHLEQKVAKRTPSEWMRILSEPVFMRFLHFYIQMEGAAPRNPTREAASLAMVKKYCPVNKTANLAARLTKLK